MIINKSCVKIVKIKKKIKKIFAFLIIYELEIMKNERHQRVSYLFTLHFICYGR